MSSVAIGGEEVTYTRRFFGDNWLESLLQIVTLGIGWLIWLAIVAPKGQTPAKQILNVYIHDFKTGQRATAGKVWLRDVVWKAGPPFAIAFGVGFAVAVGWLSDDAEQLSNLGGLYVLVGALWIFGEERRTLWDRLSGTVVRYHPGGFKEFDPIVLQTFGDSRPDRRLQELELLRSRGLITDVEYQEKRQSIIAEV
jgi:hypothetical protein